MVRLQNSISKHLHHHIFLSIFFNKMLEAHHFWILSCFSLEVDVWLKIWSIFLIFGLSFLVYLIMFWTRLGVSHFLIANIFWCACIHPIDPMGIHFLYCVHSNKCTQTHDVIRNTLVAIIGNASFHSIHELLHAFLSTMFYSFRQWINIVFTKNKIHNLIDIAIVNIVIVDSIRINLLPWICTIQRFTTFDTTQTKKKNYCKEHPIHQILLLTIKIFEYLHK
jgi:hypothetical protein